MPPEEDAVKGIFIFCAEKVKKTLLEIENVKQVKVNLRQGKVTIIISGIVENERLKSEIEALGYLVKEIEG